MGLTAQQQLYNLPNYILILKKEDNSIVGLISNNYSSIDKKLLDKHGYYIKTINFDALYSKGLKVLGELGVKNETGPKWMTVTEYLEKLHEANNEL